LNDCDEALKLNPNFVKAYIRKAHLETVMKQYHKAIETYDKAMKLEPENEEIREGVNRVVSLINQQQEAASQGKVDKEAVKQAMADPEIQQILQDSRMREVLTDLQSDPTRAQHHLSDPQILKNIQKLVSAGILQVK